MGTMIMPIIFGLGLVLLNEVSFAKEIKRFATFHSKLFHNSTFLNTQIQADSFLKHIPIIIDLSLWHSKKK